MDEVSLEKGQKGRSDRTNPDVLGRNRNRLNIKTLGTSWNSLLGLRSSEKETDFSLPRGSLQASPLESKDSKRLPIELIAYIIDFLHCDFSTLAICCRVSHTWLDLCRQYLYRVVQHMVPPNAESFLSALKSLQRSRMVWKYIQTLVLGCSDHYCDDSLRRPVLCSHLLMQILEGLPNLQNLNILYARFIHKAQAPYSIKGSVKSLLKRPQDSPSGSSNASAERCIFNPKHSSSKSKHATVKPRPTFSRPLKQFNLTATGSLEDPSFAFQEILALFSSFKSCISLFVDFDFLHDTRPAEEPSHIQLTGAQKILWDLLPRFECLKVVFSDPSTTSSPQSLAALRIRCPSAVHFEYLAHFLPDIDPELQHFDIDPSTMYKDVVDIVDWTRLDLARFTRMKTLSFTIDYASLVDYDVSNGRLLLLCHFPAAFLATASRDITRISIRLCLRVRDIKAFNGFMDWETLEDELLKFPNLVRVKFKRITSWGKDDDYEDLASLKKIGLPMKLPRLRQSGLLSLVETPNLPYINVY